MKWTGIGLLALTLIADVSAAQTATDGRRVLSTVPEPPAGASAIPAQMSGMPLQVGDLPPGIVAVRVIRRTFEQNVAGQVVQMRVGSTGRVVEASTAADGRAQFPALQVGDLVRVRTTLDGEVLESQPFPVAAQGGVRLVLVGGVGAGSTSSERWIAEAPAAGTGTGATPAGIAPVSAGGRPAPSYAYAVASAVFAVIAAGVVLLPRRRRAGAPDRRHERSELVERLARLEKDFKEGRLPQADHQECREALIQELIATN